MADNDLSFFNKLKSEADERTNNGYISNFFGKIFGAETEQPTATSSSVPDSPETSTEVAESCTELDEVSTEGSLSHSSSTTLFPSRKSSRLKNYNDSNFKQYWMPDSTGKECYQCEERFTTFRRRHHCRLCGQIFCAKCCSNHVDGSSLGYIGDLRLCNFCTEKVKQLVEEKTRKNSKKDPAERKLSLVSQTDGVRTISDSTIWLTQGNRKERNAMEPSHSYSSDHTTPTLLSVQQLYTETSPLSLIPKDGPKADEDESGPDWFRSMNTGIDGVNNIEGSDSAEVFLYQPTETDNGARGRSTRLNSHSSQAILLPTRELNERNNHLNGNDKFGDEFSRNTRQLIKDLLKRENISEQRWLDQLLLIGEEISNKVKCESVNIVNQVHIKKLLVADDEPTTEIVWGTVCSKSLLHEEMIESEAREESVMLVSGSVEYERITNKLSSIEPIINQEKQFLEKQIERIMAKRASLIIVEGDVTRIAANLLHENGVRVAVFTKPSVLERISKCTGADIVSQADAQLLDQNHGFCSSFQQHKVQLKNGSVKSLLVFSGCSEEIGCTILLRSNSVTELIQVKQLLRHVITINYSNRLEKAFLSTMGVDCKQLVEGCSVCQTRVKQSDEKTTEFEKKLHSFTLTTSPFISANAPYLESAPGKESPLLVYFKQPLYKCASPSTKNKDPIHVEEVAETYEKKPTKVPVLKHPFSRCSSSGKIMETSKSFRALGSVLPLLSKQTHINLKTVFNEQKQKVSVFRGYGELTLEISNFRPHDVFDPRLHQRVAVLFGSMSRKSPNAPYFCVRPWVVSMCFYEDHDMTLGDFLTKYCFNKSYECPSSNCDVEMADHSRKLVFSNVCLEITVQTVSDPLKHQEIIFWQNCTVCDLSSRIVRVDHEISHLSFAKFLDYLGNGHSMKILDSACPHCCLHQKHHFFAFASSVCQFKVNKINPFCVQFSPMICRIKPATQSKKEAAKDLLKYIFRQIFHEMRFRIVHQGLEVNEKISNELDVLTITLKETVLDTVDKWTSEVTKQIGFCKELSKQLLEDSDEMMLTTDQKFSEWREAQIKIQVVIASLILNYNKAVSQINEGGTRGLFTDAFFPELHLTIPLPKSNSIIVRDVQDQKGVQRPDIGSVIAYALSVADHTAVRFLKIHEAGPEPKDDVSSSKHLDVEFHDDSSSYFVKIFYAREFLHLRNLLFTDGENAFIKSLSQSTCWTPQGGKSGSFFYRTEDNRFIMKQMSKFEIESFVKFGPNYLDYLVTASTEKKLTALCKVYGVFKIGIKTKSTQLKTDILVMEYLFYNHDVTKVWDLKGSLRNRYASAGKGSSVPVLLDENFVNDLWNQQIYVLPHSKAALSQAISNDSHFLSSQYVMDYSLLVGVNDKTGELVLGIVDYMRTYTLDKKLESWVKIVAIPGAHLPTILSPEMYCARFSEAIDSYFPVAPDQWTGLGTIGTY